MYGLTEQEPELTRRKKMVVGLFIGLLVVHGILVYVSLSVFIFVNLHWS